VLEIILEKTGKWIKWIRSLPPAHARRTVTKKSYAKVGVELIHLIHLIHFTARKCLNLHNKVAVD
jgi:hypothetical protein